MSHEGYMSGEEKLVYMANQIANFFESADHSTAVDGIADHINKFWEPRMRRHFLAIIESGGKGLRPAVVEAAAKVKPPKN